MNRGIVVAPFAAALILSLGLAGCAPAGEGGDTLRVIRGESFDGWNPDGAAAYATYQTLVNVLEPLLRSAPNGADIEAGLATEWVYDAEQLTWTFTLRDGIAFSDGTPLTSADVAFSSEVWKEGANFGELYSGIESVSTPDDATVVFQMVAPDTTLPVLMTWTSAAVYPEDFGGRSLEEFFQDPVGAGAYAVERWSTGGEIELVASEHYYEPIGVDRILLSTVTDANQGAAMLESGQADISEYLSSSDIEVYGEYVVALPPSQIEHLSFNTVRAPLDDVAVRTAIAYAIDYASIVEGAFRGYGTTAQGVIPSGVAHWAAPTEPTHTLDLDAARAALADAVVAPDALEVVYDSANQTDNIVAQILKTNLSEIGIDLTLSPLETGAFLDRAYGGDADLIIWSYGAISPDVVDPLGWILGTSWLFSNADTDTLLDQFFTYSAAEDDATKEAIAAQVQDDAITEVPVAPLAEFQVLYGVGDRVSGFDATPWGMYRWADITVADARR